MSEILEFFRQPDTADFIMDPYAGRMQLEIDIRTEYAENSSVTIRGRLLKDGQPYPGIEWPRDEDDQDLDTTRIGIGQAIMGLQVEKDRCGSSIHWEFEMQPGADGWFSVTTSAFARIPGLFVFKISAEGLYEANPAPDDKIIAFFRNKTGSFTVAQQGTAPQATDIWVAGSLGQAGVSANIRHRIKLLFVDNDGKSRRVPGEFVLPMIPRVPQSNIGNGGLVIDNGRIAGDAMTGDVYLSGYGGPIGNAILERAASDGTRSVISLPGIQNPEASAVGLNATSRTLWLRIGNSTHVVDLNTLQVVDRFETLRPFAMCADLGGDGVWAALSQTTPQRRIVLARLARDGTVLTTVKGFSPSNRPTWIAPLRNGGVVSMGTVNRTRMIVAADATGTITAQSGQWTHRTADLDADPVTGQVSAIVDSGARRGFVINLGDNLQPVGAPVDPVDRFGQIDSLITAARASSDRTWLGGLQFNPNPPPGQLPIPIGHLGYVNSGLTFTPARGTFRAISLARAFK